MTTKIQGFLADQSGAVTVDWTILTAGLVGISLSAVVAVRSGAISMGGDIESSLVAANVANAAAAADPTSGMNFSSALGYRDMQFYFFNPNGVNNWYRNNVQNLSDANLLSALQSRQTNMESEMSMGPNDAPSYGEPWGHTDMYHLTLWEAKYRRLI